MAKMKAQIYEEIQQKVQEMMDTVTYLTEDLVNGEYHEQDGNVTTEFAELMETVKTMVLKQISNW